MFWLVSRIAYGVSINDRSPRNLISKRIRITQPILEVSTLIIFKLQFVVKISYNGRQILPSKTGFTNLKLQSFFTNFLSLARV